MWEYYWTIFYEDDSYTNRKEAMKQPRHTREDPNNPSRIVTTIRMDPEDSKLPSISIDVPKGCRPVFHRHTEKILGGGDAIHYRIGWRAGDKRMMIAICPETNLITQTMDKV